MSHTSSSEFASPNDHLGESTSGELRKETESRRSFFDGVEGAENEWLRGTFSFCSRQKGDKERDSYANLHWYNGCSQSLKMIEGSTESAFMQCACRCGSHCEKTNSLGNVNLLRVWFLSICRDT